MLLERAVRGPRRCARPQPACARPLPALDEPLRVAIAGKVKAGKSTLLNALVGEELAPTDAGECTRIVTWYRDGVTYRVTLYPHDRRAASPCASGAVSGALDVDLGVRPAEEVERLVVEWPSASLRETTLIDTPGIGSLTPSVSARTERFLGRTTTSRERRRRPLPDAPPARHATSTSSRRSTTSRSARPRR